VAPHSLILIFPFKKTINLKEFFYNYFLSRIEKSKIFLQIAKAVKRCHSQEIAHRDIKLDNIVISPNRKIFLIDFGYSIHIPNLNVFSTRKFCGTPLYMAPEVIAKKQHNRNFFLFMLCIALVVLFEFWI
jgi:serine/threonine protein kinase